MTHRYLAGALGLSIAVIAWRAWWRRRTEPPGALPFVLFTLVLLQALVGMWTVTLLLKPVVVTAHLLGGMATLALLWWMFLEEARSGSWHGAWPARYRPYRVLIAIAAVVLVAQLFIGGWTSANYAALVCQEFPRCQGEFWPPMRLAEGFTLWRDLGGGPAHGGSEVEVLVGIHMAHRLGALLVVIVVAGASVAVLMQRPHRSLGLAAVATIALVFMQVALGISIVITARPLEVASAHTAIAALLLLAVLTQWHELVRGDPLGADRLRRGTS
jgi:cytochrome c oxidase assembly protein subunit 15